MSASNFPALAHLPRYMQPWSTSYRTFDAALIVSADTIGRARRCHKEFTIQDILSPSEAALETPETLTKHIEPWDFALALVFAQALAQQD